MLDLFAPVLTTLPEAEPRLPPPPNFDEIPPLCNKLVNSCYVTYRIDTAPHVWIDELGKRACGLPKALATSTEAIRRLTALRLEGIEHPNIVDRGFGRRIENGVGDGAVRHVVRQWWRISTLLLLLIHYFIPLLNDQTLFVESPFVQGLIP